MKKLVLFTLSMLFVFNVCSARPKRAPASTELGEVARFARSYMHSLQRSIYTYHYVPRAVTGIRAESSLTLADPAVASYLRRTIEGYWDENSVGSGDAPGFYLAVDPFASRHFGRGPDWLMFRVELKEGLKVLDLREMHAGGKDRIPDEVQKKLAEAGCPYQDFYLYLFRKKQNPA